MPKELIQLLKAINPAAICEELELLLYRLLQQHTLENKERLLDMNEICDKVYFIEKGLFRSFRKFKGQEENVWFMKEGDVMHSPQSFYGGKPSKHGIESIGVSVVYSILKSQLDDIYERFPKFERTGRLLTEKYYLLSLENWEELGSGTVKDKYNHFLKTYPGLDKRLSAKHIASFLKCSVRSIQRVRGKKN